MVAIFPNLHIGSLLDYAQDVSYKQGWRVIHACKEPYHRQALGYSSRAAPKNHPEYLIATRGHRLILNLIDPDDARYIPKEIIDAALEFVKDSLAAGTPVLVHCNQGESRAPSIGFLYLLAHTDRITATDFEGAVVQYHAIYPNFNPSGGMFGFMQMNFQFYLQRRKP